MGKARVAPVREFPHSYRIYNAGHNTVEFRLCTSYCEERVVPNRLPIPDDLQHLIEKRNGPRRAEDEERSQNDSGQSTSDGPISESPPERRGNGDRRQSADSPAE